MGKKKTTQADTDSAAPDAMAAMMAMNPVATKAWMDIVTDSTRFVTERLQQDLETQQALLACKSPAELMQVQSEFFKTALEQYSDEATRLHKIMSDAMRDAIEDAKSGYSRGYDDVPL